MTAPAVVAPAHLWVPERVGSYGDEAVDLARMAGRELDPEQVLAVDALLSYGPGGRWLALESAIVEARQNGKTAGVLLPVVLFDLFLLPPDRIVWTAHLFKTARDAFADFRAVIDATPELSRRVKKITSANGEETILLHSGAKLEFLARAKGGGRGLGGKRLVMDEALYLSAESMGALIPTLSARPDPQINYGASAGVGESDQLRALRDRGRAGGDPSLIWVEWCAPGGWDDPPCAAGVNCSHRVGADGCALDDESLWPCASHTLGRRITYEYVRAERRALPPEEFGRERMGWFDLPDGDDVPPIDAGVWQANTDPDSAPVGTVALAVDVTPDRTYAAIAAAGRRSDGHSHVELVAHLAGTDWLVARLVELQRKHSPSGVWLDPAGPVGSLLPALEAAGVNVTEVTSRQMAQACGAFYDSAMARTLHHRGDPELFAALSGARKRDLGDAWAWSRKKSADICPLVAATLAVYGAADTGDGFNIW